jgi:hypothetical protein
MEQLDEYLTMIERGDRCFRWAVYKLLDYDFESLKKSAELSAERCIKADEDGNI